MRTIATFLCLILATAVAQQTYQLVWADEFNGNSLDRSKWQYEVNCDGGGNNELQCYTANERNVAVRNGSLVLTALSEGGANGKRFSSGRINTRNAASWKYGRFEARAKLPNGIYLWPALWMMPKDSVYGMWAASGEIDIMENHGGQNNEHSATLHFGGGWPNNKYESSGSRYPYDLTNDFHIYSCIWTPQSIQFLLDGNVFHTQSLQRSYGGMYRQNGQPFDQPFYFIINLAVGGGFFGGNANALTNAQAQGWRSPRLEVDYVRAYQLKDGVGANPVPAPAPAPAPTPTPTPTPAPNNGNNNGNTGSNGGCPAGACGGNSCCLFSGAQHCYDKNVHGCPSDVFSNKFMLCPKGMSACKGACFNPNQYKCNNGNLSPK